MMYVDSFFISAATIADFFYAGFFQDQFGASPSVVAFPVNNAVISIVLFIASIMALSSLIMSLPVFGNISIRNKSSLFGVVSNPKGNTTGTFAKFLSFDPLKASSAIRTNHRNMITN